MDYRTTWNGTHPAVASLTFLRGNERVSSGSGFKVGSHLVTNNHVIQVPTATSIAIRFVGEDGATTKASYSLTPAELKARLRDGEPETSWDFAILDIDIDVLRNVPSLALAGNSSLPIGSQVALLGYQFEQPNLSIHTGVLSSRFARAGVKYLQLDASVNQGNSGGPLLDPESGHVIGIVTRKATGLTQQFDALLASFDANIRALEAAGRGGSVMLMGVNPLEMAKISQVQLQGVALEIKRSANVGVGYAYDVERVRSSLARL